MELLRLMRVVRQRWALVAAVALVGLVAGAASTQVHASEPASERRHFYSATATLGATRDSSGVAGAGSGYASLDQIAVLVPKGDVPREVAEKLGGDPQRLAELVTVTSNNALGTLQITAIGSTPTEATTRADAFADALLASLDANLVAGYTATTNKLLDRRDSLVAREAQLDAALDGAPPGTLQTERLERDAVVDQLRLVIQQIVAHSAESVPTNPVEIVEPSHAASISAATYDGLLARGVAGDNVTRIDERGETIGGEPASTKSRFSGPISRGVLGGFLGMMLGIGLALGIETFDRRLRTGEETAIAFGLPLMAEIPGLPRSMLSAHELSVRVEPYSRAADAFRRIRSSAIFGVGPGPGGSGPDGPGPDGPGPDGPGSAGPDLHQLVVMVSSGVPAEGKTTTTANLAVTFAEAGANVLVVDADFRRPSIHQFFDAAPRPGHIAPTSIPGVSLVSGVDSKPGASPTQMVESLRALIDKARADFDVILLDTAPVLSAIDAIELAPVADLIVLVARYGYTKERHARQTVEQLGRWRDRIPGVVLVASHETPEAGYYDYERIARPEEIGPPRLKWEAPRADGAEPRGSNGTVNGSTNGAKKPIWARRNA